MICPDCRAQEHDRCKEKARQERTDLSPLDRAGGQLCDCHHRPPQVGTNGRG